METEIKLLPQYCYSSKERKATTGVIAHHISGINLYREGGAVDRSKAYGMQECFDLLVDLGLSYHYLYGRNGEVWQLVPDDHVAWHAGKSILNGVSGCNSFTQGHCLVGSYLDDYTDAQIQNFVQNTATIMGKYGFTAEGVARHRDVSGDDVRGLRKGKKDPSLSLDWAGIKETLGYINKDMG